MRRAVAGDRRGQHAAPELEIDDRRHRHRVRRSCRRRRPSYPTLRTHRLAIGLYYRARRPAGAPRPARARRRRRAHRAARAGRASAADLLLLNDDDLTYAKIRLDARSLETALAHPRGFSDSLARSLVTGSLWDMPRRRDGRPGLRRLPARCVPVEDHPTALRTLLAPPRSPELHTAVNWCTPPGERAATRARRRRRLGAVAGPPAPAATPSCSWSRHTRPSPPRPHDTTGSEPPSTARGPSTASRRPRCAGPCSPRSRPPERIDAERIDRELARDPTVAGRERALSARAARPTPEAKEQAWALAVEQDAQPNAVVEHLGRGSGARTTPRPAGAFVRAATTTCCSRFGRPRLVRDRRALCQVLLPAGPCRRHAARRLTRLARRPPQGTQRAAPGGDRTADPWRSRSRLRSAMLSELRQRSRRTGRRPPTLCSRPGCRSSASSCCDRAALAAAPAHRPRRPRGVPATNRPDCRPAGKGEAGARRRHRAGERTVRPTHRDDGRAAAQHRDHRRGHDRAADGHEHARHPARAAAGVRRDRRGGPRLRRAEPGQGLPLRHLHDLRGPVRRRRRHRHRSTARHGTVEDVTLRVTLLRDGDGVIWYIRNGEIIRVGNRSQGLSTAIVDLPIAYAENVDRAIEVIKAAIAGLEQDPTGPSSSRRADRARRRVDVGRSGHHPGHRPVRPNENFAVQREIRERLKAAFDREGRHGGGRRPGQRRAGRHELLRRGRRPRHVRAPGAEFYRGVAGDPPLRDLYPEDDLAGAEQRLRMFLEQYWGGPRTYSEERGHPRLRMRHRRTR